VGLGGLRERITIDLSDIVVDRCLANEMPKKPLPPAMTMRLEGALFAIRKTGRIYFIAAKVLIAASRKAP
jgi:hypothetical protein